jgi:hypothetical protein
MVAAVCLQVFLLTGQSSASVTLTVRIADGRTQFRPGEIIPIELEFNSATPKRFAVDGATYDRSGRLTIDRFSIDRIDEISDPMLDYFGSVGGYIGGGLRGTGVLGEKPFIVTLELNEWFRFDKPGVYRLSVTSQRVTDESAGPRAVMPVDSNTVSFEIVPADPAWQAAALEDARRIADAPSWSPGARTGCRTMRFLGTEAAAMEMSRRLGADSEQGCDFEYMAGLFSAPNRAGVVRAMEEGLRAPDRPVTATYLRTLSVLSVYVQHPEFRPAQTREAKGRLVTGGELSRRSDLIDAALSGYREILSAALPDKTGHARAITLAELPGSNPLAAVFLDLPVERQVTLLEYQWRTIAGPAMLPALRRLIDRPASNASSLPDLALRRLAELAPDEARPLILRQIQMPRTGATVKTLGSLPDAELPALDDVLAANLEASLSEINAALVQRYATKKVAARILASVDRKIGRLACRQQASILAYFLRVDESIGAELLERALASRETGCWRWLNEIADLGMSPVIETRAARDLDSPDPDVAIAAIQTLGRHGSPAARDALRSAFERWHANWKDRSAELTFGYAAERPNARQAVVEDAFRQAIGAGAHWVTRADELRELESLCVTDNCRTQTGYMIHEDDTRIRLSRIDEPDQSQIELAQYRFASLAALEEKLAQYPRGTLFTIQRDANETAGVKAAAARLVTFAGAHGLSIRLTSLGQ